MTEKDAKVSQTSATGELSSKSLPKHQESASSPRQGKEIIEDIYLDNENENAVELNAPSSGGKGKSYSLDNFDEKNPETIREKAVNNNLESDNDLSGHELGSEDNKLKFDSIVDINNSSSDSGGHDSSLSRDIPKLGLKDSSTVINEADLEHPYTAFSKLQQSLIFAVIIFIGFLGPMSGNIYIPALPILEREFNVSTTTINTTVSVFMAVFSFAPLLWAIYADYGGRKLLYVISMGLNVIVNILLASIPTNIGALYFLRIAQAFASSSVISLGAGTVSDITSPKDRGKAVAYFMLGPNAGPVLAPIIAGIILMNGDNWRWLFGFTSIMAGVGFMLVCLFLPETLRCIVGNGDLRWKLSGFADGIHEDEINQPKLLLMKNFGIQKPISQHPLFLKLYPRPPKPSLKTYWDICKELNLTICSLSTALLFATYYGFSVTFSHYLTNEYGYSNLAIGACYACPGVALMMGSIIGGHSSDYFRKSWIAKHSDQKYPSYKRLLSQIMGLNVSMVGCIGYGWAIQLHYHVAALLFFSFLMAFGMTWCSNSTMTYLTESNPKRAAGTIAVSNSFRNIAAAISSAIIFKLCDAMGVGWCFTGLGLCDLISVLSIYYLIRNGNRSSKSIN
ncbi:Dtr1p Ecym_7063 [Eremothecium cymbalariae DBVPG|uniref:Major facilitator superfamily (MFS) profile domain-containing protein n=1 Tax=Eremothecium cymbalariae (strain CBS 270.75 / DBVPG 7215 / KCTC 17166 / NRRL Y-17582) TaxID=931890 RepID=G8JVQ1_ERECY|nr:hypothetical protein Ecym_7063 [Eremothecium cymbalariae DBVPG\